MRRIPAGTLPPPLCGRRCPTKRSPRWARHGAHAALVADLERQIDVLADPDGLCGLALCRRT
ncbi:MAG: hypothetical protein AB7V58_10325 [Solirubrobacterales bacterium]